MIVICDIDGTIADCTHRLRHIQSKPKDWHAFHTECLVDPIIENIRELLYCLQSRPHQIVYVTGRPEHTRELTLSWLKEHAFPPGDLFMRKPNDYREDFVIKAEVLDLLEQNNKKILCALEDRTQVVEMWRGRGVTCLQVKEGDY